MFESWLTYLKEDLKSLSGPVYKAEPTYTNALAPSLQNSQTEILRIDEVRLPSSLTSGGFVLHFCYPTHLFLGTGDSPHNRLCWTI